MSKTVTTNARSGQENTEQVVQLYLFNEGVDITGDKVIVDEVDEPPVGADRVDDTARLGFRLVR